MTVELKICERCGVLWLRPVEYESVYCANCLPVMSAMVHKAALRRPSKAGAQ